MKKYKLILVTIILFLQQAAFADLDSGSGFKRSTAIVLFSGLSGAVLGLSTLSFYDKPQEHANNITYGALIGLIAGAGYVVTSSSNPEPAPVWGENMHEKDKRGASWTPPAQIVVTFEY